MSEVRRIHPYIPNSVPETKAEMLAEIGVDDVDRLYDDIPESLRFRGRLNIPQGLSSELDLQRHVEDVLGANQSCAENLSFLGGGCYHHYVPAICDEIVDRSEFLTAYAGEPYEDHGRFQALFEYESLMAELLELDVVNVPTYDWGQAASTSIRMAGRITGRSTMLVADSIAPSRLAILTNYCEPVMKIELIGHSSLTGKLDLAALKARMDDSVAGVYFENPSYLGSVETDGQAIADAVHAASGVCIVGVDPTCLGVIVPPSRYGADIVCGEIQGLGNHMHFGGILAGFIATRDKEAYVAEYPSRLFGICKTAVEGEWGFGDVAYERTSFGVREQGKEFIGTAAALYGISTAVYLSLMGPQGMRELGQNIIQKTQYAMRRLTELPNVTLRFDGFHFKEFVLDFSATASSVEEINAELRERSIFGGKDLGTEFENLKCCALYALTERHTKKDIDRLATELKTILG
ncbi:MAG: aminomethyl-transferring glycine dehydrogenase subunit GcvPA [bacterium]|nr:aminomethyl-transferring glycine dehydrogenase subunit GcvPA [bacterium]